MSTGTMADNVPPMRIFFKSPTGRNRVFIKKNAPSEIFICAPRKPVLFYGMDESGINYSGRGIRLKSNFCEVL